MFHEKDTDSRSLKRPKSALQNSRVEVAIFYFVLIIELFLFKSTAKYTFFLIFLPIPLRGEGEQTVVWD